MFYFFYSLLVLTLPCFAHLDISLEKRVQAMSVEEKVGQLLIVYCEGEEITPQIRDLICKAKIGGVIYYNWANGLQAPLQVENLSEQLQSFAKKSLGIPLLIAIDQEGGVVARLQKGFTEFPGNAALGRTKEPEFARLAALYMGKELSAVGVNFNLAPVVDINSSLRNPIIGVRSFGSDKKLVTQLGRQMLLGFKEAGVIACLKHFPGSGEFLIDPHAGLTIVEKSWERLQEEDLFPFKELVKEAPVVMTSHAVYHQIDPHTPATLSSFFLKKVLREQLGFQGVVISDSLTMSAVLSRYKNLYEVAFEAFQAGNDLLLIGGRDLYRNNLKNRDFDKKGSQNLHAERGSIAERQGQSENANSEINPTQSKTDSSSCFGIHAHKEKKFHNDEVIAIHHSLVQAVQTQKISEERLNASVVRILQLKQEAGLFDQPPPRESLEQILQNREHQHLAKRIATLAVEREMHQQMKINKGSNLLAVAPGILREGLEKTDIFNLGKNFQLYTWKELIPSSAEREDLFAKLHSSDYLLFFTYNAWKTPEQAKLLKELSDRIATVCIITGDPQDRDLSSCNLKITTYSPVPYSLQAAVDQLRTH